RLGTRNYHGGSIDNFSSNFIEHGNPSRVLAFSFYILWTCAHGFAMRQRRVLDDNEWAGWLQWMRNSFRNGTISEIWKQIGAEGWFNPSFPKFINTAIATGNR